MQGIDGASLTQNTVLGPMVDLSLVKYQVEKLSAMISCPTAMMNSDVCSEGSIVIPSIK